MSDFIEKNNINIYDSDNQTTGEYGHTYLVSDLYKYCTKNKLKLNKADFELLMEAISRSYTFDNGDISYLNLKVSFKNYWIKFLY